MPGDAIPTHAPTELMQLRKAKALAVFNNHSGRFGYMHPYFDHGGTTKTGFLPSRKLAIAFSLSAEDIFP